MTGQLQWFGCIGLSRAEYVVQVRINRDLSHGFDDHSNKKSGQMGIFRQFSNKMQLSLITVSLEDAQ